MVFSNLFFMYIFMPLLLAAYYVIKNNIWRRIVQLLPFKVVMSIVLI